MGDIKAANDKIPDTVYQKMKKVAMKLEEELLKDLELLPQAFAEAIDFAPVLDAIANIDLRVIVKGQSEDGSRPPCADEPSSGKRGRGAVREVSRGRTRQSAYFETEDEFALSSGNQRRKLVQELSPGRQRRSGLLDNSSATT